MQQQEEKARQAQIKRRQLHLILVFAAATVVLPFIISFGLSGALITGDYLYLQILAFFLAIAGMVLGFFLDPFFRKRRYLLYYLVAQLIPVASFISYVLFQRNTYSEYSASLSEVTQAVVQESPGDTTMEVLKEIVTVERSLETLLTDTGYQARWILIDSSKKSVPPESIQYWISYNLLDDTAIFSSSFHLTDNGLKVLSHRIRITKDEEEKEIDLPHWQKVRDR